MIIYDLCCDHGHKYEGWFQDRQAFETQRSRKLITCPVCGSMEAEIVPASVTLLGKDKGTVKRNDVEISPLKYLEQLHQQIDKYFDDVGEQFAEVAIRIHRGEEDQRNIRGVTTEREEDTLREEGVPFVKIPVPKFDS
ncbi:MAG TPA: DUF1178 domain-containing protein [Syntrophus sp. (in: bacteria)]|nr:DUF1178 domain-containing protein [Syntrophus sp. (in: bacteria)]